MLCLLNFARSIISVILSGITVWEYLLISKRYLYILITLFLLLPVCIDFDRLLIIIVLLIITVSKREIIIDKIKIREITDSDILLPELLIRMLDEVSAVFPCIADTVGFSVCLTVDDGISASEVVVSVC